MTAQKNMETSRNMGDAGGEVKKKTTTGDGKIAGQGTKKDTVTTLLFKTRNEILPRYSTVQYLRTHRFLRVT